MATYFGDCRAQRVKVFTTTADLRAHLKSFSGKQVDAIFHAAAVSDFAFGRMFMRDAAGKLKPFNPSKKISTRSGNLLVELAPTPKIIAELRDWFPKSTLVGWKYEANGGRADALRAAQKQITGCSTDACVANGPAYGRGFGLVTTRGKKHFADKTKLFASLADLIA
jgi:phosphopantothenoylcysteine decarboxylase/phosphopantothenate--cysteine ligase